VPPYVHPDAWNPCGPEVGGGLYPFESPSADVFRLLADVALSLEPPGGSYAPPLRVAWIHGLDAAFPGIGGLAPSPPAGYDLDAPDPPDLGEVPDYEPAHACDVVVWDAEGRVAFDSTAAEYAAADHGPYLRVHRWRGPAGALRVVQRTRFPDEEKAYRVPAAVKPRNGVLDARAVSVACRKVDAVDFEGAGPLSGAVRVRGGWNFELAAEPTRVVGIVRRSGLAASAAPGSGEGPAPCDESPAAPSASSLGGASADARGRLRVAGDGCYRAEPEVVVEGGEASLTPGRLVLRNHCRPCCSCAGYVELASSLVRAWGRLVAVAGSAEAARDALREGAARWSKLPAAGSGPPYLVRAAAVAHNLTHADLVVEACNRSDACLESLQVDLVATPPEGSTVVPRLIADACTAPRACGGEGPAAVLDPPASGARPYVLRAYAGLDRAVSLRFDKIQPRSSAAFRLRYEFAGVDLSSPATVVFTYTADGGPDSVAVVLPPGDPSP